MSLVIANNVASLTAQNNLSRTATSLGRSLERLSSGLKINRGADGPSALVVSEQQRAQIAGLQKAIENTERGVSMIQTAEGALTEINSLLVKVRGVALDSANNAVNDANSLAANQAELRNALDTITRIANNTQFGTRKILEGSAGISGTASDTDVTFLKGTTDTSAGTYAIEVTTPGQRAVVVAAAQTTTLAQNEILTVNGVTINLTLGMDRSQVKDRINEYTNQTGVVADDDAAANTTRLRTVAFGSAASITVTTNVTPAGGNDSGFTSGANDTGLDVIGKINDVSYNGVGNVLTANTGAQKGVSVSFGAQSGTNAHLTVDSTQGNVTIVDNSLIFQIGANASQSAKVAVDNVKTTGLGIGIVGNQFANLDVVDIQTASGAADALEVIDAAINTVSTLRGRLGAFQQQTLESTSNNLRTTLENTVNAESVIRDTDFAFETANFTKQQVLMQAGTTVLSSANQIPQLIVSLLGR